MPDQPLTGNPFAGEKVPPMSGTEAGHRRIPDPDDLGIYISKPHNEVPYHVWLKFKADVLSYVANKLKDLGT